MELLTFRTRVRGLNHHVRLYVLGDFHVGSAGCDHSHLERTIKHIEKDEDGYAILMGDLCECINKCDRRHDSNAIHPMFLDDLNDLIGQQERYVRELIRPLAEQKKILACLMGNHERTFEVKDNKSLTKSWCHDLDIPYGGYSCVVGWTFTMGNKMARSIRIHAHHGHGGGRKRGSKVNKLDDQQEVIEGMDIYARGHSHLKVHASDSRVSVTFHQSGEPLMQQRKVALLACGSFLRTLEEGVTSYAEVAEYKPVDLGAVFCEINPFKPTMRGGRRLNLYTLDARDLMI